VIDAADTADAAGERAGAAGEPGVYFFGLSADDRIGVSIGGSGSTPRVTPTRAGSRTVVLSVEDTFPRR